MNQTVCLDNCFLPGINYPISSCTISWFLDDILNNSPEYGGDSETRHEKALRKLLFFVMTAIAIRFICAIVCKLGLRIGRFILIKHLSAFSFLWASPNKCVHFSSSSKLLFMHKLLFLYHKKWPKIHQLELNSCAHSKATAIFQTIIRENGLRLSMSSAPASSGWPSL